MPLHLLGKKSWNVYNADNIAKVKHDETLAAASEAAEEQRMQEVDAANRIRILRGLPVAPLPLAPLEPLKDGHAKKYERRRDQEQGRDRKRRRIAGEDETEREIRIARENTAVAPSNHSTVQTKPRNDMPLIDGKGHINLFPIETPSRQKSSKNAEAEAEFAKKKREYEDQYTMRFSNAAGFKQDMGQQPWYSSVNANAHDEDDGVIAAHAKDIWGNEDPRRKDRYTKRLTANDPLSAMKRGVEGLREVEKERNRWKEERDRDIQELIDSERPSRNSRKKKKSGEIDRFEWDDERASRRKSKRKQKSGDENGFYSDGENASRSSRKKKPKPRDDELDSLDDEFKSHGLPLEHSPDHHHHHHHHHHQKRQKRNASKERPSQQSHHRHRGRSRDRSRRQNSRHRRPHRHQCRKNSIEEEDGEEEEEEQEEPAMEKGSCQES